VFDITGKLGHGLERIMEFSRNGHAECWAVEKLIEYSLSRVSPVNPLTWARRGSKIIVPSELHCPDRRGDN